MPCCCICVALRHILILHLWATVTVSIAGQGAAQPGDLTIVSIEDGAVVPANWARPLVEWRDSGYSGSYVLKISSGSKKIELRTKEHRVLVEAATFAPFLKSQSVAFSVSREGSEAVRPTVLVSIDPGRLEDRLAYRLVEPLFNPIQGFFLESLRLDDGEPNRAPAVGGLCAGCHAYGGESFALNARKGADRRLFLGASSAERRELSEFRIGEFSFLSLSPDGASLAAAVGTASLIRVNATPIEPFDMVYAKGDIAIAPARGSGFRLLPGASSADFIEDMPSWSPDGKSLVFARYATDPALKGQAPISIYSIAVNEGRGGEPVPIMKTQPSPWCYFPHYSPDGRWISFVAGDASRSCFARQSANIWLASASTGELVKLAFDREDTMESMHSWSSDSKWLAFSRRGSNGITAIWLSRIEADGKARPPVKLTWGETMKANLPVFVAPGGFDADAAISVALENAFEE